MVLKQIDTPIWQCYKNLLSLEECVTPCKARVAFYHDVVDYKNLDTLYIALQPKRDSSKEPFRSLEQHAVPTH